MFGKLRNVFEPRVERRVVQKQEESFNDLVTDAENSEEITRIFELENKHHPLYKMAMSILSANGGTTIGLEEDNYWKITKDSGHKPYQLAAVCKILEEKLNNKDNHRKTNH